MHISQVLINLFKKKRNWKKRINLTNLFDVENIMLWNVGIFFDYLRKIYRQYQLRCLLWLDIKWKNLWCIRMSCIIDVSCVCVLSNQNFCYIHYCITIKFLNFCNDEHLKCFLRKNVHMFFFLLGIIFKYSILKIIC